MGETNRIWARPLAGRVAVVTGAGGGLGEGICAGLAACGATVVAAGRTRKTIERIANQVTESGGHGLAIEVDVADRESVEAMTERVVREFGGVDILVNNAAIYPRRAWTEI